MTTVTTVGDGTFSPSTVPGRASGIDVMVLGVGFLLALAGALIEHFVRKEERARPRRSTSWRGRALDLNDLIGPSPLHLFSAEYINDGGDIVAEAVLPNGDRRIALLVPSRRAAREAPGAASTGTRRRARRAPVAGCHMATTNLGLAYALTVAPDSGLLKGLRADESGSSC